MSGNGVIQESTDPLPFVHPPPDTLLFRPNPEATPARLSKFRQHLEEHYLDTLLTIS